ncbi:MAG: Gfo/Idh/MocA family oxidoreductase [Spirochaetales bacterium]
MANKITGVIVGAGFMGKEHLECSLRNENISIIGVVDKNRDTGMELSAQANCPWYADLEKLYAHVTPDYVDICLPSSLHKDCAVYAMEHGSHVLVEKPFAVCLEDIDAMIAVAKKHSKRIMVAHVCRFMPQYRFLHEAVIEKKYGSPISLTFFRESSTPNWSWNNWLHDKKISGGTIMDLSIHDIDLANWLLGIPHSFYVTEAVSSGRAGVSEILSVLHYDNNVCAKITANHLMPLGYPLTAGYKFVFEQGAVEWNTCNTKPDCIAVFTDELKTDINIKEYYPEMDAVGYFEEISVFAQSLINNTPFPISVEDARLAVETVLNLNKSIDI